MPTDLMMHLQALRSQLSDTTLVNQPERAFDAQGADAVSLSAGSPAIPKLLQTLHEGLPAAFSTQVQFHDVGTVQHIGNGVATLSGLAQVRTDEVVVFPTGVRGLVLNLDRYLLDVILLGADEGIRGGDLVTATGQKLQVPVGTKLLSRIVNPLGEPLDELGTIEVAEYWFLERDAPGIVARSPVDEPLHTGLKLVDALIPIGRGQRELIVGDRQTGKTALAVDAILNQRDSGVKCVYVAIGQKKSSTLAVIETLRERDALAYTTVVASSPDDPPALRYLAPYTGCTIAEYLMDAGHDVLIVYDDLSKHADAYRELSLLLRRPPGREAYPGDIFYLHSRLLERACRLKDELGGRSLTALPIVETQRGNLSAYIPTNLISITDGQIMFDSRLFNQGTKPAVNVGLSVSRVGGAAQTKSMRSIAGNLRLELAQFEEVARFARFGTEVDEATRRQIEQGTRIQAALTQSVHQPLSLDSQILILFAVAEGLLDDVPESRLPDFEQALLDNVEKTHLKSIRFLDHSQGVNDEDKEKLARLVSEFLEIWQGGENA